MFFILSFQLQAQVRTYQQVTYNKTYIPECVVLEDLKSKDYYRVRSRDKEVLDITEEYLDDGTFVVRRVNKTPEANRPGRMRGNYLTVETKDNTQFFSEAGELLKEFPASDFQFDVYSSAEDAKEEQEYDFPLIELLNSDEISPERLLEDGYELIEETELSFSYVKGDTLLRYLRNGLGIYTKYTDFDSGVDRSYFIAYQEVDSGFGRVSYQIYNEYTMLSTGDSIVVSSIITNSYLQNSSDLMMADLGSELTPPTLQALVEGERVSMLRWKRETDSGQCSLGDLQVVTLEGQVILRREQWPKEAPLQLPILSRGTYIASLHLCDGQVVSEIFTQN